MNIRRIKKQANNQTNENKKKKKTRKKKTKNNVGFNSLSHKHATK